MPRLGPGLHRRAPGGRYAEDAHRLEAEAQLLAADRGGDVMPAELLRPLQPVADRVAVREQLLGGGGNVAVVVEVGLDRLHQLGLVLLVVGGERLDRLGVEPLQLPGVLAHRPEQQPVGAGVLEGEKGATLGLADVDRQPRLVAGPGEVDGIGGATAAADRRVEGREALGQLSLERRGRTPEPLLLGGRDDHRDHRGLGVLERRERSRRRRAQRADRQGQHARPPFVGLRRSRRRPQHQRAGPLLEVGAELCGAGADVAAVGDLA